MRCMALRSTALFGEAQRGAAIRSKARFLCESFLW
jgi:hypothetical protein